jgi:hypothetical protein
MTHTTHTSCCIRCSVEVENFAKESFNSFIDLLVNIFTYQSFTSNNNTLILDFFFGPAAKDIITPTNLVLILCIIDTTGLLEIFERDKVQGKLSFWILDKIIINHNFDYITG